MKKRIVAITMISLLAVGCYSIKKYKAAAAIIEKLVVHPKHIKNVKVSLEKFSFTFDLQLLNQTHYDLGFTTGSLIEITEIKVFTLDAVLLADIKTDISAIELPANGSFLIENIQVELATYRLIDKLDTIIELITTNNLQYQITIKAFGKEFKVWT
ncbi:hypothetical protein KORDIASMS9_00399 [Kordia sp. SMS9]|uniref:hypothetical protein n=1 Tax=Kordia sp. SMS9 TaxID=2282170 RepID=UPI000E0DA785|nr:hypothetical protein [Kordia sp. SMS9]AXG68207.1 hypothetical protein KORDIASMS9_00399 [Kordia sp. SMS9]